MSPGPSIALGAFEFIIGDCMRYAEEAMLEPKQEPEENCCDNENNQYDDDSEDIICRSCKEHACEVKCRVCGEVVFASNCCG